MKSFQDKINYNRLLTVTKNKQENKKSFKREIFITDIYILRKPWKNIHKFLNFWTKILENLEMYKNWLKVTDL